MSHERRVFFDSEGALITRALQGEQPEICLDNEASHHLAKVLRLQPGDPVIAVERTHAMAFESILVDRTMPCKLKLLRSAETPQAASPIRTIIFALGKNPVNDLVCEKCCELGADQIVFWKSERCILDLRPDQANDKLSRWKKIAEAAAQQCGRNSIPGISLVLSLTELLARIDNLAKSQDRLLCCALSPRAKLLRNIRPLTTPAHLLVGPAGDLTEGELNALEQRGFELISLGSMRLRSETAAIAAMAMVHAVSQA